MTTEAAGESARRVTADRREDLRARMVALGFDEVRFSAVSDSARPPLAAWLAAGHQADMNWMDRTAEKRLEPERVLPGVRSVIALGVNYWQSGLVSSGGGPIWARYALHSDYHDTLKPALMAAGREIERLFGVTDRDYRYYADTGPVLERHWAARSGLGYIGRNAMLISRRHGNWLLLAAILTRLEFDPDPVTTSGTDPGVGRYCGTCRECLDACPTDAFPQPGVLDSRRCISYQTIENSGIIPRELRPGIGLRLFGCDVCLDVCPWNRFAREGRSLILEQRGELAALTLREILSLSPRRFAEVFRRTAVKRLKLRGLLRNACVAAGNSGDPGLLDALVPLVTHREAVVRAHAVWAVYRIAGPQRASRLLETARQTEKDDAVLAEYLAAGC